jgi:hypothetical protein
MITLIRVREALLLTLPAESQSRGSDIRTPAYDIETVAGSAVTLVRFIVGGVERHSLFTAQG